MSITISEPVLLVVNADSCHHCRVLVEKKDSITKAMTSKFPKVNNIWLSLDKMNFSILPCESLIPVKHFPIIFYFPRGVWGAYLVGDYSRKIWIMSHLYHEYGLPYDANGITRWLDQVIEPGDRSENIDNWSNTDIYPETQHRSGDDVYRRHSVSPEEAITRDDVYRHHPTEESVQRSEPVYKPVERPEPVARTTSPGFYGKNFGPTGCHNKGFNGGFGFNHETSEVTLSIGNDTLKTTLSLNAGNVLKTLGGYLAILSSR